jgi:hypothetical protein
MAGTRASNPNAAPAASPSPSGKKSTSATRKDNEGATSSNYLQQTRADNPEPAPSSSAGSIRLSECRFETPIDKLRLSESFGMSCKVDASGSEPPKDLNVTFRLFCSGVDAKGAKTEEDLKANWSAKLANKTGSQVVAAKGTLFRPKTLNGASLEYHLTAEHPAAKEKCASAKAAVSGALEVEAESLLQEHFLPGGVVPLLDIKGRLPEMLASAIAAASKPGKSGQNPSLLIQGHADTSDSKGVERSQLRALGIRAILDNDGDAFSKLALANGSESEFYKNLEALSALGWGTDPKTGKPEALRDFQADCQARFGMRIAEDLPGPLSWKALHRCIVAEIQERLGEDTSQSPRWKKPQFTPANKGIFGWGAAAPAANGPKGRIVDLLLYHGKNPGIQALPPGLIPSLQYNVLEDTQQVTKKPLPPLSGQNSATKKKFDVKKMVEKVNANAQPKSVGKCASFVRIAFQAGGGVVAQPYPISAKNYGPTLVANGFTEFPAENYEPKLGDIIVFQAPPGEVHGHIQIFNGSKWVSDFTQNRLPGANQIWPGSKYEDANVSYTIYRYEEN